VTVSADDKIKPAVVAALVKKGWTITDDPLTIEYEELYVFVDLGGERMIAAERGAERIAVEIKSFPTRSFVADLHPAVGQYAVYRTLLQQEDPGRRLYLAVTSEVDELLLRGAAVRLIFTTLKIPIFVVDMGAEEVVSWTR
jgi:hypothetical protein